jgi:sepiapterin reductase
MNISANITSTAYFTSEIVKKYTENYYSGAKELVIVNISSLAAIKPFSTWSVYCMGKAAREMFHQVLAEEHKNSKSGVKVLNYAPGPLDTDMQKDIREAPLLDAETQVK